MTTACHYGSRHHLLCRRDSAAMFRRRRCRAERQALTLMSKLKPSELETRFPRRTNTDQPFWRGLKNTFKIPSMWRHMPLVTLFSAILPSDICLTFSAPHNLTFISSRQDCQLYMTVYSVFLSLSLSPEQVCLKMFLSRVFCCAVLMLIEMNVNSC